jgi:hypothetical protein
VTIATRSASGFSLTAPFKFSDIIDFVVNPSF